MEDLGSGCFIDLSRYGMKPEPTVQEAIQSGVDVVSFSGDKLLGGPQAGIILGKKKALDLLRKNPLNRALRIDKLTLAGLEATLRLYLDSDHAPENLPVLSMLTCPVEDLERRARNLRRKLTKRLSSCCQITLREESSQVGGGALPLEELPTRVLGLRPLGMSASALEERLRKSETPVIARVKEEEVLLDVRTVADEEEEDLLRAVQNALQKG
jgi:L-seryl-tRNA(Ser) seleniumtransferase